MSVAYYITTEPMDDEIVRSVDGKRLARAEETLRELAVELGLPPLDSFVGLPEDLESFGLDVADLASDEPPWYEASDGVEWFDALQAAVSDRIETLDDGEALYDELGEFLTALKVAHKRGLKWQLVLDL